MHVPDINTEEYLSFLSRQVQIKSYSETDGELEITNFIAQKTKDIGLKVDIYPFADGQHQNAIGRKMERVQPVNGQSPLFNSNLYTNPVTER